MAPPATCSGRFIPEYPDIGDDRCVSQLQLAIEKDAVLIGSQIRKISEQFSAFFTATADVVKTSKYRALPCFALGEMYKEAVLACTAQ